MDKRIKNIVGQKFGRLTVIKYLYSKKHKPYWLCQCDCGNEYVACSGALRDGNTRSCGCLAKESFREMIKNNIKHGMSESKIYYIYKGMKQRCYNPTGTNYKNYGGRGIKVCDEWLGEHGFENFYKWAIDNGYKDLPHKQCTIDRIDVNGNYEPNNCKWSNAVEQANNTRRNVNINFNGKTQTLTRWCRELDLSIGMVLSRIHRGVKIEIALTTPKTDRHKYYEYNGEKYTIQQLSKMFNIPEMTLYSRLNAGKLYKDNVFTAKGKRKV